MSVTGTISLAKLHGSLSWDKKNKYTSGKPGRSGKAFIVPPAPEKVPPTELTDVWELGAKILEKSKIRDQFDVERVAREIRILKMIRHPFVV